VSEGLGDDPKVGRVADLAANGQVDVDELLKVRKASRVASLNQGKDLFRIASMTPGELDGRLGGDTALEMNVQLDLGTGFEIQLVRYIHEFFLLVNRDLSSCERNETATTAFK
jgi:hypothetical protein